MTTPSTAPSQIVILGAGLAGATAAETLRDEGFAGTITLVGEEADRPYDRPPLSKAYLQGEEERDTVFLHPADWYPQHGVDLRLGVAARALDRAAREVTLADGSTVGYDALLLATGSSPRRLPVPGADLDGVHYLRRLEDADGLREALRRSERAVVVGGGWIGLEFAAAARAAGVAVTVVETAPLPLLTVLGPEVAQVFAELHRAHGVDLRCGVGVGRMVGEAGALTGVELDDGSLVAADLAVVGIGAVPNTGLAEAAGLEVANGIRVDEHLRTADPHVFAAGDVANAFHPVLRAQVRVEHWVNALHQGPAAARSILGQDVVYDEIPFFYTDQYELGMEYRGYVGRDGYDEIVLRGDVPGLEFTAFWLKDGHLAAGMNVNIWDGTDPLADLVASGRRLDIHRLRDPAVPVTEL
jgi:3-phenylpropionate/trans-cinnamate dioxygenase ferredoxin reductase subunit